jgi:hypothetical protein
MTTVEITPAGGAAEVTKGAVPIRIEVADPPDGDLADFLSGEDTRGPREWAARAGVQTTRQIYAEAIEMACAVAEQTARRLEEMGVPQRPDEFEVQFALNIDVHGDAKIVSVDSGAQVQVRMQWNRGADA